MMRHCKWVLYAPNIHVGGGLVLLRPLLSSLPKDDTVKIFLDERARAKFEIPEAADVQWVKPTILSRLNAERTLSSVSDVGDNVFCFHGLPPVFRNRGRVIVFQQNRNYFDITPLRNFSLRTGVRLAFERFISRRFRGRVSEYIVQTPSMARDLVRWYCRGMKKAEPAVRIVPFVSELPPEPKVTVAGAEWDFVYVADGEAHKNHRCLLEAWRVLAQQGLRPKLALTLGARDGGLEQLMVALRAECGAEVHNLGQMPHEQVIGLYRRTRALIFPSLGESFGLPLIEAQQLGVPIVASELDYVRDVCEPAQTFDPRSAQSIARAVKRFLQQPELPLHLHSPAEFWTLLTEKMA